MIAVPQKKEDEEIVRDMRRRTFVREGREKGINK